MNDRVERELLTALREIRDELKRVATAIEKRKPEGGEPEKRYQGQPKE